MPELLNPCGLPICGEAARVYEYEERRFEAEPAKLVAALAEIGESLESPYDDEYIARKRAALENAGIRLLRFKA